MSQRSQSCARVTTISLNTLWLTPAADNPGDRHITMDGIVLDRDAYGDGLEQDTRHRD